MSALDLKIPSRLTWRRLCEQLDREPLSDDSREAIAADLAAWPDAIRVAPGRWLRALAGGREVPGLRLARRAELYFFDDAASRPPWAGLDWLNAEELGPLRGLRVYDERGGDSWAHSLARASFFPQLTWLAVAAGLGAEGAAGLAAAAGCLEFLDLGRNQIGEEGVRALVQSSSLSALRALHLGRNALDARAVAALAGGFPRLEKLDLDCARLGPHELSALCSSGRLRGLRELNLSNNSLGRAGCEVLAACPDLASLETLFLHECAIDDEGAAALLSSPHLGQLRKLAMSANALTSRTVEALCRCEPLLSLGELDICHNDFAPPQAEEQLRRATIFRHLGRLCV